MHINKSIIFYTSLSICSILRKIDFQNLIGLLTLMHKVFSLNFLTNKKCVVKKLFRFVCRVVRLQSISPCVRLMIVWGLTYGFRLHQNLLMLFNSRKNFISYEVCNMIIFCYGAVKTFPLHYGRWEKLFQMNFKVITLHHT